MILLKKWKLTPLILLALITQTTLTASCLTTGDYHLKFWGGGLHVWLYYPEDARPGDSVNINLYIVSSKFPRGNFVGEVNAKVTVLTSSSQVTLFDQKLISDTYMQSGSTFNHTMAVSLPADARWYITVQVDSVSYQQDMTNRQEAHVTFEATKIVSSTYSDLQENIQEYQVLCNGLDQKYKELSQQLEDLQTPISGDCTQIQSDYLQLMQEYTSLTNQYNALLLDNQSLTSGELEDALHELEGMYSELQVELEATITSMEDAMLERDEYIEELEEETQFLSEENQNLVNEVESLEVELTQQQIADASEDEYNQLQSRLNSALYIRNIFGLTSFIFLAATIVVYLKFGKKMF